VQHVDAISPTRSPSKRHLADYALPVATAALRSLASTPVSADDHASVLKVRAEPRQDLSRSRNQVVTAARGAEA
jgi:hypothetical protein